MKIKKCREIRKNNTEGCFGLSPFSLIWAPPRACCARSFTYLLLCLTWQSYPEGTTPHTSSSVWSVDCFCVCLCVCVCVCVCACFSRPKRQGCLCVNFRFKGGLDTKRQIWYSCVRPPCGGSNGSRKMRSLYKEENKWQHWVRPESDSRGEWWQWMSA